MKTSSKILFMMTTLMSTIMVVSSSTWMNMWIGLEVNLMSFIPLMSTTKNPPLSQSMMMYFLTQSLASMLFIMIMLTNKYLFVNMKEEITGSMIVMSMVMKMGMPPFHLWFPEAINKMKWNMCFMLMTWQKIAPMYIASMFIQMSNMIISVICLSSMVGAIGGINQTSTRKMMAYSSINHMSWMIACAATFKKSWTIYLMIYSLMMWMFCMMMHKYNILYINQMNMFFLKKMDKIIIISVVLSIGGIPPFLGFMPKWISIQYMITSNEFLMMTIMVVTSLITLSYYLKLSTSMNMIMSHSQKWVSMIMTSKKYSMLMLFLNMTLPVTIFTLNF